MSKNISQLVDLLQIQKDLKEKLDSLRWYNKDKQTKKLILTKENIVIQILIEIEMIVMFQIQTQKNLKNVMGYNQIMTNHL